MEQKKLVEHYRDHEISCLAEAAGNGWRYTVSVVTHLGDASSVRKKIGDDLYPTDIGALHAGIAAGRELVDAEIPG